MRRENEHLAIERNPSEPEGRIKYELQDMSPCMKDDSWDLGLDEELSLVESKIKELVASSQKILTDVALHVIDSGGKRLRPSLAILAHHALDGDDLESVIDIAAALELIHSATLLHDDINDGAEMRRGRKAAYKKYGQHEAIVAGDFMFARAFHIGGKFDEELVDMVADCCKYLAEGEMIQYTHREDTDLSVDEYLRIIEGKTAYPIRASAQVGAFIAEGSSDDINALGDYGLNIGIAFQIVDDILDIVGDEECLGKMTGSDLREGNMTLPIILACEKDREISKRVREFLGVKSADSAELGDFLESIRESGGIESSLELAKEYASGAEENLEDIPDSVHKDSLIKLTKTIVDRSS